MPRRKKKTLKIEKVFCKKNDKAYESVEWGLRDVILKDKEGAVIFKQLKVQVPDSWSERSAYITASKYFRGQEGTPAREFSVKQLFDRVVNTIASAGVAMGYFDQKNSAVFTNELKWLLINQRMAFNSPVFFNVGAIEKPQGSACFILGVEDTLESIIALQVAEASLFSQGSGAGSNLSYLRGAGEPLSRGGEASGPMSFIRAYDAWAGVIKSGGVQRRASKMLRLNDNHPDVWNGLNNGTDFISFKSHEEKKAWALIDAGYSGDFRGEAYRSVAGQNANLSVGLSDKFMQAVLNADKWATIAIKSGEVVKEFKASEMLDAIAEGAWLCGDPGIQFHDRINEWNTCSKSGPIRSSNPCGEFLFLDNSACNLASLNLLSFMSPQERLFYEKEFAQAVRVTIIAQDILVGMCGYPSQAITEISQNFRPLGLGFCNLGGILMAMGIPYDSDEGRLWASAITSFMTGQAYIASHEICEVLGPFAEYSKNKRIMSKVIRKHRAEVDDLDATRQDTGLAALVETAQKSWAAVSSKATIGFRNSQVTLVAPTGTISHMMDSATQGVEPELTLVWQKELDSGGSIGMMNNTVPVALECLGYTEEERQTLIEKLKETKNPERAGVKEIHLPVFDCAYPPKDGKRHISVSGHLKMLAAVQPFISGGISKTINVPRTTTAREIRDIIVSGWKLGLKSLTTYRAGSKRIQPISDGEGSPNRLASQRRLPDTRMSETHKFVIGEQGGYITLGFYDDGAIGEVFLTLAKEGTTVNGFAGVLGRLISCGLQRGVPVEAYIEQLINSKFDPRGLTGYRAIPSCQSIADYLARFLDRYTDPTKRIRNRKSEEIPIPENGVELGNESLYPNYETCPRCGNLAQKKNAGCIDCDHCGFAGACGG